MPLGTREVLIAIRAKDEASRIIGSVSSAFKQSGKDMDETTKAAQAAGKQTMAQGAALMGVGAGMAAVGAVGLAFYADMAKGAIEYNKEASLTLTQVNGFSASLEQIKNIGKDVASQVGAPFEQMQGALYDIFSSTDLHAKDAQAALTEFSKAAVAGSVSITQASDAGISILNGFQYPITDLNRVMDAQFKTVQIGRVTYDQLSSTIGRAIPSAQKAGASVEDLGGMLAFMTRNGMSAAMAATSAARAYDLVSNPVFADNMKAYGMSTADATGKFLPMTAIVQELQAKMQGMSEIDKAGFLKNITFGAGGTIQAMRFLNEATNDTVGALQNYTTQVKNDAGSHDAAYKIMAETPAYKLQMLKNNWQILRTEIGDKVVPVLNKLVNAGTDVLKWFEGLSSGQQKAIVYTGLIASGLMVLVGTAIAASGAILLLSGAWAVLDGTAKVAVGINAMSTAIRGLVATAKAMSVIQWTGLLGVVAIVAEIGAQSLRSMHQYNDFRDNVQKDLKTSNLKSLSDAFNKTHTEAQHLQDTQWTWTNFLNVGHALATKKAADDLGRLKEQYQQTSEVLKDVAAKSGLSAQTVQMLADKYGVDLTHGVQGATTALMTNITSLHNGNVATQNLDKANAALADTVDGTTDGFKTFKDALDATFGIAVSVDEAHINLAKSTKALADAYKAAGGQTNLSTTASQDYVSALVDQAKNIVAATLAEANAGDISALSADQKQILIDKLGAMAKAYPGATGQIQNYINAVSSIQTQVATTVNVNTTKAIANIEELNGKVTDLYNNLNVMGPVLQRNGAPDNYMGPVAHRAMGGAVEALKPYIVGEHGQELFIPTQAGEIINARNTSNLMNQANGALNNRIDLGDLATGSTMPAAPTQTSSLTIGPGAIQIRVDGGSTDVAEQVEAGVISALRQLSNQVKAAS